MRFFGEKAPAPVETYARLMDDPANARALKQIKEKDTFELQDEVGRLEHEIEIIKQFLTPDPQPVGPFGLGALTWEEDKATYGKMKPSELTAEIEKREKRRTLIGEYLAAIQSGEAA